MITLLKICWLILWLLYMNMAILSVYYALLDNHDMWVTTTICYLLSSYAADKTKVLIDNHIPKNKQTKK